MVFPMIRKYHVFYKQMQINSAITAGFDGKMAKNGIDIHLI